MPPDMRWGFEKGTSFGRLRRELPHVMFVSSPEVMYAFHFYAGTHSFLLPRLRQYASQIPIFATDSWPMFC